jgi:hypothetical protein
LENPPPKKATTQKKNTKKSTQSRQRRVDYATCKYVPLGKLTPQKGNNAKKTHKKGVLKVARGALITQRVRGHQYPVAAMMLNSW